MSGSEFVSFFVAFSVVILVFAFSEDIQEFSIAGNVVRLKEAKEEAEQVIKDLNKSRIENYNLLFRLILKHDGVLEGDGPTDKRVHDFWELYNQVERSNFFLDLRDSIYKSVKELLSGQLDQIRFLSSQAQEKYTADELPDPDEILLVVMDNDGIERDVDGRKPRPDVMLFRNMLIEAVREYRRLYELYHNLSGV